MLSQFVRLVNAPPQAIELYAKRWGVLEICEHNMPASHWTWCAPRCTGRVCWEPLEVWRYYARNAKAVLMMAAQLHTSRRGSPEVWRTIFEPSPSPLPDGWEEARTELEHHKGKEVRLLGWFLEREWLQVADFYLSFEWNDRGPKVQLGARSLFSALALQLVFAVSKMNRLGICAACGSLFLPGRVPNPNRRAYCERCRRMGRPQRDAARDYRARKRSPVTG
jgi:hypothetical protein